MIIFVYTMAKGNIFCNFNHRMDNMVDCEHLCNKNNDNR